MKPEISHIGPLARLKHSEPASPTTSRQYESWRTVGARLVGSGVEGEPLKEAVVPGLGVAE